MMHLASFWALGKCFFSVFFFFFFFFIYLKNLCFIVYIGCNLLTMGQVKKMEASDRKMGPNNMSGVVWALG